MKKYLKPLYNGIIKENPTFVLMLGMVANSCGYNLSNEWNGNGTYDYDCFNYVEFCYLIT